MNKYLHDIRNYSIEKNQGFKTTTIPFNKSSKTASILSKIRPDPQVRINLKSFYSDQIKTIEETNLKVSNWFTLNDPALETYKENKLLQGTLIKNKITKDNNFHKSMGISGGVNHTNFEITNKKV